jgi:uncharacterized phage protein (TIGR02216 family)
MRFGFGILRMSARDFWAMTPRELHRAMEAHGLCEQGFFLREDLDRLMQMFPDEVER